MFERFTDRARRVVVLAQEEARMLNHNYIGTEHLLLGLIHEGEGIGARALESLGVTLNAVREQVQDIVGPGPQAPNGHIPFTPRAKKVPTVVQMRGSSFTLHPAREEGSRTVHARGYSAEPRLHRHRTHPAGHGSCKRGRGKPGAGQAGR